MLKERLRECPDANTLFPPNALDLPVLVAFAIMGHRWYTWPDRTLEELGTAIVAEKFDVAEEMVEESSGLAFEVNLTGIRIESDWVSTQSPNKRVDATIFCKLSLSPTIAVSRTFFLHDVLSAMCLTKCCLSQKEKGGLSSLRKEGRSRFENDERKPVRIDERRTDRARAAETTGYVGGTSSRVWTFVLDRTGCVLVGFPIVELPTRVERQMSDNPYKATAAEHQEQQPKPWNYGCLISSIVAAAILLLLLAGSMVSFQRKSILVPTAPSSAPPTAPSAQP